MFTRTLISVLAATGISTSVVVAPAILSPASAQANLGISLNIGTPPPAPVYEVVPAPRVGYVWAPGYWHWEGGRHVWAAGHWMPERAGFRYVPERWERYYEGGRERWRFHESRWDRAERHAERGPWGDKDHDGIPNRYDRHDNRFDHDYRR